METMDLATTFVEALKPSLQEEAGLVSGLSALRDTLEERLNLRGQEFDSVVRLIRSQMEFTLERLTPPTKENM